MVQILDEIAKLYYNSDMKSKYSPRRAEIKKIEVLRQFFRKGKDCPFCLIFA